MSDAQFIDGNFLAQLSARLDSLEVKEKDLVKVSAQDLEEAIRVGKEYVRDWEKLESQQQSMKMDRDSSKIPSFFYLNRHNPQAIAQSKEASVYMMARNYLSEKLGVPADKIDMGDSRNDNITNRQFLTCDKTTPFRTMDGTCNNLGNPLFGKSSTIFGRMIPPDLLNGYSDALGSIRRSQISKSPLPSARLISTTVTVNDSIPDPDVTLITMQWGQFLDHDLTLTPGFSNNGSFINCCSGPFTGGTVSPPPHQECLPISVPANDPAYNPTGNEGITCMNFVRSTFGSNLNGSPTFSRTQINSLTHWIDGSNVYGSTSTASDLLRDKSGKGKLRTFNQNGRQLLPFGPGCSLTAPCFDAGDGRVNEQPLLSIMHTIWVREHNRIADQLVLLLPGKSDDFYFQQARRVVIAEMQHIIYTEYLPVLLGPDLANQVLSPDFGYTPSINPAIFNEFSTAAFRMGHSQLRNFLRLFEADGRKSSLSYLLSDSFNDPGRLLNPAFIDNALRGLIQTSAQSVDNCFADDITSQLFKPKGKTLGLDLIALNIQRGRDHGLPPYLFVLNYLTSNLVYGTVSINFDYLTTRIPLEVVSAFKTLYESVYDIDLFIGGVTEKPLPRAVLGPTFANIFALQFLKLRQADRFFYNHNIGQPFQINAVQLAEIEKVSLARIICDNSDGTITKIQPKVFRRADELLNKPVACRNIPGINFSNWVL